MFICLGFFCLINIGCNTISFTANKSCRSIRFIITNIDCMYNIYNNSMLSAYCFMFFHITDTHINRFSLFNGILIITVLQYIKCITYIVTRTESF